MKELREQIQVWLKENETEYYGLDRVSVNTALWRFEDVIDKVEEMQKALETFADINNWNPHDYGSFVPEWKHESKPWEIARQALKGLPNDL